MENSGYLSNLLPGDVVLAKRNFNVAESMAHYSASLYIPAFTRGVDQLDPTQVEVTRKIMYGYMWNVPLVLCGNVFRF